MSGRERGGRNGEEGEGDEVDVEDGGPARKVATVFFWGLNSIRAGFSEAQLRKIIIKGTDPKTKTGSVTC